MKKFLKLFISLIATISCTLCFTACDFDLGSIFGDIGGGSYLRKDMSAESIASIVRHIDQNVMDSDDYVNFQSTYTCDYNNTNYNYSKKYNIDMKVNGNAEVGEVFALIDFYTYYAQEDGQYGRDMTIKYCIVRTGTGTYCNNYRVYMNLGGQTYSATYSGMLDKIEQEGVNYSVPTYTFPMLDILENDGGYYYYILLMAYAEAYYGDQVASTTDNPFIYCLHDLNGELFVNTLKKFNENSKNQGYSLYASGENSYKLVRKYKDLFETYDEVSYFTINDNGTYTYKMEDNYKTTNPARGPYTSLATYDFKPLTTTIEIPSWAN